MRVTLLAGLVACMAVSAAAGGAGGPSDGGGNENRHTGDANGGAAGGGGDARSGDSRSGNTGAGGQIGGNQSGGSSSGGNGGNTYNNAPVNTSPIVSYGNAPVESNVNSGNGRGGDNGGNRVGQDNSGAQSQGGDSKNKGGDTVAGSGGPAGSGGNTGQTGNVAGNGGYGGQGGSPQLSVPISPIPFMKVRRSLAPVGLEHLFVRATPAADSITVDEIVGAINKNQKLPGDLESAFLSSKLGKEYKAPANRGPVDPALASQDTKEAVAMVQSGEAKVPPQIITALEQNGWTKVSASKRDIEWTPRGRTAAF